MKKRWVLLLLLAAVGIGLAWISWPSGPAKVQKSDIQVFAGAKFTPKDGKWFVLLSIRIQNNAKSEIYIDWCETALTKIAYVDGTVETMDSKQRNTLGLTIAPSKMKTIDISHVPGFPKEPKTVYATLTIKLAEFLEPFAWNFTIT